MTYLIKTELNVDVFINFPWLNMLWMSKVFLIMNLIMMEREN